MELLSKNDWITIIDYSHLTGNKLDDIMNMNIKNNFWKTIKDNYDWVVVCDFDECLYCENWDAVLDECDQTGAFCLCPEYNNMVCEKFPEYIEDSLFHYNNKYKYTNDEDTLHKPYKMLLFNVKNVFDINLTPGGHDANPISLQYDEAANQLSVINLNIYHTKYIQCYHLVMLGLDFVMTKKNHNKAERMTQKQLDHHFAVHYMYDDEKVIETFNNAFNKRTLIEQI